MSDEKINQSDPGEALAKIREFIFGRIPNARKLSAGDDAQLLEDGLLDSLGILDVVTFLEDEFEILVDDEDLTPDNFQTINLMVKYVQNKVRTSSLS